MAHYIETHLESFEQDVLLASQHTPVLLDFWAEWCPPCLVIAPVLERVVSEYHSELRLAKLEVDEGENMKLAGRYKVRGFPTIMLIVKGHEVARFSGARPAHEIEAFLDQHL